MRLYASYCRTSIVQSSIQTLDAVYTMRQTLLTLLKEKVKGEQVSERWINDCLQTCWLEKAAVYRKANLPVNAYGKMRVNISLKYD